MYSWTVVDNIVLGSVQLPPKGHGKRRPQAPLWRLPVRASSPLIVPLEAEAEDQAAYEDALSHSHGAEPIKDEYGKWHPVILDDHDYT